jgi:hypothetical protein
LKKKNDEKYDMNRIIKENEDNVIDVEEME